MRALTHTNAQTVQAATHALGKTNRRLGPTPGRTGLASSDHPQYNNEILLPHLVNGGSLQKRAARARCGVLYVLRCTTDLRA